MFWSGVEWKQLQFLEKIIVNCIEDCASLGELVWLITRVKKQH